MTDAIWITFLQISFFKSAFARHGWELSIFVNMRKPLLSLILALAVSGCVKPSSELTLLVGTYTDSGSEGIYTYRFDSRAGSSKLLSVTPIDNPSFLTVSGDGKIVYSVSEQDDESSVSAFDFDASEGALAFRNRMSTFGRSACHVCCIGKEVVATNYSSGSMTIFPLDDDGDLKEGTLLEFSGSGPVAGRQECSHIHSSQLSHDGRYLFVTDLGGDLVYRFPVKDGEVSSLDPYEIKVPAGQGPRHFTFSRDGRFMYVLTELGGTVVVYEYAGGDLRQLQVIDADPSHAGGSADIHFSPDGKFLYASNRLKGDGLAIFSQDSETGLLTWVGYQETGLHPRNFTISSDGRFVLVACRDSNKVQVFKRDCRSGLLTDLHKDIILPHPVYVQLVPATAFTLPSISLPARRVPRRTTKSRFCQIPARRVPRRTPRSRFCQISARTVPDLYCTRPVSE